MGSNERGREDGGGGGGRGVRVGCEERRSDSRLLLGVPLIPSPMRCCSPLTSRDVSSELRCSFRAVPPPVCLGVVQGSQGTLHTLFLRLSETFTRGGLSC